MPVMAHPIPLDAARCSRAVTTVYELALKTEPKEFYLSKEYTHDIPKELLEFHIRIVNYIYSQNVPADVMAGMFLTECIRKNADPNKIFLFKQS